MENKICAITDAIIEGDFEVTRLKMAFSGFDTLSSFIKYSILTKYMHIPYHSYSQFRAEFEKSYFTNMPKVNSISELVDRTQEFCRKHDTLKFDGYISYGKHRKYQRETADLLFKADSELDKCLLDINNFISNLGITYTSPFKSGETIKMSVMLPE